MLQRRRVDEQRVGALPIADRADVGEVDFLRCPEIVNEGAGRRDGRRMFVEAEAFEAAGAQLIKKSPASCLVIERPAVDGRDGQAGPGEHRPRGRRPCGVVPVDTAYTVHSGDDDLARPEDGQFIRQRLHALRADILGRGKFPGGQIEQRRARGVRAAGAIAIRNAGSRASR